MRILRYSPVGAAQEAERKKRPWLYVCINPVAFTRVRRQPIYHSFTTLVVDPPLSLDVFEKQVALARRRAEERLRAKIFRGRIRKVMEFVVVRPGIMKGRTHTEFVVVFRRIWVDEDGSIKSMTAPDPRINPEARRIYELWALRKYCETGEKRYWLKLIGVRIPQTDSAGRPRFKIRPPPHYQGKDFWDLPISYLFGKPSEPAPPFFSDLRRVVF